MGDGPQDQRDIEARSDVLTFTSDPLLRPTTVMGRVRANIWLVPDTPDLDIAVRLIDVYPDEMPGDAEDEDRPDDAPDLGGMQQLVRAEIFRGRFRDSYEEPKPFTPGEVDEVSFILHDAFHTFKRGHRIMVQVQSSWFPFIDRNPQSWVPNIFEADDEDFIKAMHRVYRSAEHPSGVRVKVLP